MSKYTQTHGGHNYATDEIGRPATGWLAANLWRAGDAHLHGAPEFGEALVSVLEQLRQIATPAVDVALQEGIDQLRKSKAGFYAISELLPALLALEDGGCSSAAAGKLGTETAGWLRTWLQLPESWGGTICESATEGTPYALRAALDASGRCAAALGVGIRLTLYCSELGHPPAESAATGQYAIRRVPVDANCRMSARELGRMMECDASSGNPVSCIVATVGSEVASVDPIRELAAIARARAAWFHVDATRGGSMAIVPERRRILDGVELANSVAVSLRDWFYLPFNWNVVYTAKPGRLRPPLPQGSGNRGEPVSPRHYFQSLKPWILMRHLGRQGMIGLLRSELALARRFGLELAADPRFEIVAPVELPVVCFRYLGTSEQNRQIAERVNAAGCSLLSMTSIQGNSVLRISVRQLGPDWNTASRVCEIVKTACDDLGLAREGVASARQLR